LQVSSLGLCDEEDALALGDLFLHLNLACEAQPISALAAKPSHGTFAPAAEHRGFQNRRVRYRFAADDASVRVQVEQERRGRDATAEPRPRRDRGASTSRTAEALSAFDGSSGLMAGQGQALGGIAEGETVDSHERPRGLTKERLDALPGLPLRGQGSSVSSEPSSGDSGHGSATTEVVKVAVPAGAVEGDMVEVRVPLYSRAMRRSCAFLASFFLFWSDAWRSILTPPPLP
jgi:hypothetical protein